MAAPVLRRSRWKPRDSSRDDQRNFAEFDHIRYTDPVLGDSSVNFQHHMPFCKKLNSLSGSVFRYHVVLCFQKELKTILVTSRENSSLKFFIPMSRPVRTPEEWAAIAAKKGGRGNKLRGPKSDVWHGRAYRTPGGLFKKDLALNDYGCIVYKSKSKASRENTAVWLAACTSARNTLNVGKKGQKFQAVGGRLLELAREEHARLKGGDAARSKKKKKMIVKKAKRNPIGKAIQTLRAMLGWVI